MSNEIKTEAEKQASLYKIVKASHSAFMVTLNGNQLNGRPMATAQADESMSELWFASGRDSGKVSQINADDHVMLGYVNTSGSDWASIAGTARVVDDRAKIKALYSPIWNNWFKGPDDPNLVLIQVTPTSAEYWDSGSKIAVMIKMAIGAITGKQGDTGDVQKMHLNT